MNKKINGLGILALMVCSVASAATFNYQGHLTGTNGMPVNGSISVSVKLYGNPVSGTALYSENAGFVAVADGIFSFDWGAAGTSLVLAVETIGVTTGSNSVFNAATQHKPITLGAVAIADGTYVWTDTTGSSSPGDFLGTVSSYSNGTVSAVYLSGNPPSGRIISIAYGYPAMGCDATIQLYSNLWLGVTIDGSEMSPRRVLGSVPRSVVANTVKGQTLYVDDLTGRVGIGTNNPSSPLTVKGIIESTSGGIKFPDGTVQTTGDLSKEGYLTNGSEVITKQEMNMIALSAELQAITTGAGQIDSANNYITEVFSVSNGVNGLVMAASGVSFFGRRYNAFGSIITDSSAQPTFNKTYSSIKWLSVSGCVQSVTNEIIGSGTAYCRMMFIYDDGSTNFSGEQSTSSITWASGQYYNPQSNKTVNTVEVQLRTGSTGIGVQERNTRLFHTTPSWVTISLPISSTQKVSSAYLAVRGMRQSNDSIVFDITDGVTTNTSLPVNKYVSLAGIANTPNSMTIRLIPATTNVTIGGTSISTVALKCW